MQRRALQEKQLHLGHAIRAIEAAESALEADELAGTPMLQKIIEVIRVQDAIDIMKQYYRTDEEWEKHKRYYEEGPGIDSIDHHTQSLSGDTQRTFNRLCSARALL